MSDDIRAVALPAIVPIFPLAGVLLLPRARLPLHIFEPRYQAMTKDAIAGDGMIAMAQPRNPDSEEAEPDLYPIACLGRIVEQEQQDDGRWMLTLEGFIRFTISEECPLKHGYRQVRADYGDFSHDLEPHEGALRLDRDALLTSLTNYLEGQGLSADREAIGRLPDEPLVNALAMACPFMPAEKQALLQARDIEERGELLQTLLQFTMTLDAANDDEPPAMN